MEFPLFSMLPLLRQPLFRGTDPVSIGNSDEHPTPDHLITIQHNLNRVRVTFSGRIIEDITRALTLGEDTFPATVCNPANGV
jgi:uncharacterized protein (DUF427 family)